MELYYLHGKIVVEYNKFELVSIMAGWAEIMKLYAAILLSHFGNFWYYVEVVDSSRFYDMLE